MPESDQCTQTRVKQVVRVADGRESSFAASAWSVVDSSARCWRSSRSTSVMSRLLLPDSTSWASSSASAATAVLGSTTGSGFGAACAGTAARVAATAADTASTRTGRRRTRLLNRTDL